MSPASKSGSHVRFSLPAPLGASAPPSSNSSQVHQVATPADSSPPNTELDPALPSSISSQVHQVATPADSLTSDAELDPATISSVTILDLNAVHSDPDMNKFSSESYFMDLPLEEDASYVQLEPNDLVVLSSLDADPSEVDLASSSSPYDDLGLRDINHVLRHVSASPYMDILPPEFYGSNERRRQRNSSFHPRLR